MRPNGLKRCPQCGEYKTADAFGMNRALADGLTVWCKECKNAFYRGRHNSDADLRERKNRQRRERIANDPTYREHLRIKGNERYARLKSDSGFIKHRRLLEKEWRAANPAYGKSKSRKEQERIENDPEWRAYVNKRHRDYVRERYANNLAFKAHLRDYYTRRRAIKRGNGGEYDLQDWKDMYELADNRCLACGSEDKLTVDHVLPVSMGGSSFITNLQPLCGSCNKSKGPRFADYRTPQIQQWLDVAII